MTGQIDDAPVTDKNAVRRRRFLGGVGASGLAAAAAVFGSPTPALGEVQAQCCSLCKTPSTYSRCTTGTYYVWTCYPGQSQYLHCHCCEHGTTRSTCTGVDRSAYKCEYA